MNDERVDFIKNNFPEDLTNIKNSYIQISKDIDVLVEKIKNKMHDMISNNNFDIQQYKNSIEYIFQIKADFNELLNIFYDENDDILQNETTNHIDVSTCIKENKNERENQNIEINITNKEKQEGEETTNKKNKICASTTKNAQKEKKYYTLFDDLDKIDPISYSIISSTKTVVAGWIDLLIKTMKKLYSIHDESFYSCINSIEDDIKYFSRDDEELYKPEQIIDDLYIETDLPVEKITWIIKFFLEEMGIPVKSMKIYVD